MNLRRGYADLTFRPNILHKILASGSSGFCPLNDYRSRYHATDVDLEVIREQSTGLVIAMLYYVSGVVCSGLDGEASCPCLSLQPRRTEKGKQDVTPKERPEADARRMLVARGKPRTKTTPHRGMSSDSPGWSAIPLRSRRTSTALLLTANDVIFVSPPRIFDLEGQGDPAFAESPSVRIDWVRPGLRLLPSRGGYLSKEFVASVQRVTLCSAE